MVAAQAAPEIIRDSEKIAAQAATDNADHLVYLLQLTELELLEREKRAADRRLDRTPVVGLKAARFPTFKSLDTFDFTARPSVNKMLVAELARCDYINKRENVLLVGNPGTGKSHLATRSPPLHATRATKSGSTALPNWSRP